MKICLIAEGCYPYLVGGVSSWIHQIITGLPDYEFTVIAINPDSLRRGKSQYPKPPNLTEVFDIFLDDLHRKPKHFKPKVRVSEADQSIVKSLLNMKHIDWSSSFDFFQKCRQSGFNSKELISSEVFYQSVERVYLDNYSHLPFTDVYWTLRSMYELVFSLLLLDLPHADIYHSVSTGYAGLLGALASHVKGSPLILTEHGIYTREREEEIIKADWVAGSLKSIWIDFFYSLSTATYQKSSKVISLFERSRDIQIEIGCPGYKTQVIHNGIQLEKFNSIAQTIDARLPEATIRVGAIVRIVPIKDIKTMLQAFAIANRSLKNAQFYLLGPIDEDPEYYSECMQFLEFLQLKNVEFTGRVDVRDFLPTFDLLVLSSISEGQPLAILEGFACSLPVVSTNVGDCEALILGETDNYGAAGRVVQVMDPIKMAEAIVEIASDSTLRRQMGNNGYQRVLSDYTHQTLIKQYRVLYSQINKED